MQMERLDHPFVDRIGVYYKTETVQDFFPLFSFCHLLMYVMFLKEIFFEILFISTFVFFFFLISKLL